MRRVYWGTDETIHSRTPLFTICGGESKRSRSGLQYPVERPIIGLPENSTQSRYRRAVLLKLSVSDMSRVLNAEESMLTGSLE